MEQPAQRAMDWFGGSETALENCVARFSWPRPERMPLHASLLDLGGTYGPEMQAYLRIFERYELEACDPGEAELRAPGEKLDLASLLTMQGPGCIADVIGFFCSASVVVQQDALSFLAAHASAPSGCSPVYYFHPHDWGMWRTDPSINARLFRLSLEDDRPLEENTFTHEERAERLSALRVFEAMLADERPPAHLDPAVLFKRVDWLLYLLLGNGPFSVDAVAAKVPARKDFAAERSLWAEHPHILAHAVWWAYAFGTESELADALCAARTSHPIVAESAQAIVRLQAGEGFRIGDRAAHEIREAREALRGRVRDEVLPSDRRPASTRVGTEDLDARARSERKVARALELLEGLSAGGATAPILPCKTPADEAILELASLVDKTFEPVVQDILTRSLAVSDAHRDAAWGMLFVRAALASDLDEFDAALLPHGIRNLGPRRLRELFQAYASFDDPRATHRLVQGAEAWLEDMESWIPMAPPEPLLVLLERDTLETHRLMAEALSRASFGPANWEVCVQVAVAAGRWRCVRAVPGLRRAVERKLGRFRDATRAQVVEALVHAEGEAAAPLLWSLVRWSVEEEEGAEDPEDAFTAQMDAACFLSGLLRVRPDAGALAESERLLKTFLLRLGPTDRPRGDVLGACHALLSGVRASEQRALADAAAPYCNLDFEQTRATKPLARELKKLAETLRRELIG